MELKLKNPTTPHLTMVKGDYRRSPFMSIRHMATEYKPHENASHVDKNVAQQTHEDKLHHESMSLLKSEPDLMKFIDGIEQKEGQIYLVGGAVRDIVSGHKKPKDYDFVTNLRPHDIEDIVSENNIHSLEVGKEFGINVIVGSKDSYEIASFRKDTYGENDAHRPESVEYVDSINEDLKRRDFTINAMAYDIKNKSLIDLFNGQKDMEHKQINTVGDPTERFNEDPLRILRAFRFASTNNMNISNNILSTVPNFHEKMGKLSKERILTEFHKILHSPNPELAIKPMTDLNVNSIKMKVRKNGDESQIDFLPELTHLKDTRHPETQSSILDHTLDVIKNTPNDIHLKYAALFHDISKGNIMNMDSHYNQSASIAENVLSRWKFQNKDIKMVSWLIENQSKQLPTSQHEITSFVNDLKNKFNNKDNLKEGVGKLLDLHIANEKSKSGFTKEHETNLEKTKSDILNHIQNTPFYPTDINTNGQDVIKHLNVKGKDIGNTLQTMLSLIQQGKLKNDSKSLITWLENTAIKKRLSLKNK